MRAMLTTLTMITALTCVGMASDGVIEINQARALAGGVTPTDTPGFPVTIDSPGSYRLASDLDVPAAHVGIDVRASHLSIDLNGFSINGVNGSLDGIAVLTGPASSSDVTVTNGAVHGFGNGAGVSLLAGSRVERVRVSSVGGRGINVGGRSVVSGCSVVFTGDTGIAVFSGLVTGNLVTDSLGDGITSIDGLVTGNVVSNSFGHGLSLKASVGYSGNVLTNNTIGNVTGGASLGANLCNGVPCK